jgi:hypothetical protein
MGICFAEAIPEFAMSKSRTTRPRASPARAKQGLIFLMILGLSPTGERGGKLEPLTAVVQRQCKMPPENLCPVARRWKKGRSAAARGRESRAMGGARRAWHRETIGAFCSEEVSHSERCISQIERNKHALLAGSVPGVLCHDRRAGIPAALQCR